MFDDCNHTIAHSGNSERNINKICVCIMVKKTKYIKVCYGKNYIYMIRCWISQESHEYIFCGAKNI